MKDAVIYSTLIIWFVVTYAYVISIANTVLAYVT